MNTNIQKAAVEKTAVEKAPVEKNIEPKGTEPEKDAGFAGAVVGGLGKALNTPIGSGIAVAAGAGALMHLGAAAADAMRSAIAGPQMTRSFEKALELNPRLKSIPMEQLKAYFGLIAEASPTVAKNPLLVSNYMQYLIDHEGSINFMGYKQLVDLEGQMRENKMNASPIANAATKGVFEGLVKKTVDFQGNRPDSDFRLGGRY